MITLATPTKDLASENAELRQLVTSLQQRCSVLEEQIEWFKRQIFGKRSEKIREPVSEAPEFPGFVCPAIPEQPTKTKIVSEYTRKEKGNIGKDAITLPEGIPVETQIIDIPEEDKICKETGEQLVKIGE